MNSPISVNGTAAVRTSVRVVKRRVAGAVSGPAETDFLAIEDPLEIELAGTRRPGDGGGTRMVTMRTPGHDAELIHGFLYCEGIIRAAADVVAIEFSEPVGEAPPTRVRLRLRDGLASRAASEVGRSFAVHSACGVCGTSSLARLALAPSLRVDDAVRVDAGVFHGFPARMHREQATFRQTGGLHAAAVFTPDGALVVSREDIGRHNALDKALGAELLAGRLPTSGRILCVSGRMSYEIMQKALVARIPVVAGVGAPSSLAVSLANDFNVTLIGFLRGGSYNIYSAPERVSCK
ncbi:MAG: formate dehydrogenase accessory sulfurtransferase FdhD [Opitutales bacterium]|nr:formate dehydrogenase accessory sulfurtransferase FdhD [Opitutales bacterium]